MMRSICLALCFVVGTAAAAPALESHDVGPVAISTPKGWALTGDASKGIAVAKQDPSRKDGAQLLVIVSTTSTATEDQLISSVAGGVAQNLSVVKQGPGPNGAGKLLVADGVTDGIKIRLGALAVVSSGTAVVGMLIAKQGEFDGLGGTDLVTNVLLSMRASGAAQPAPAHEPFMQPQYNGGTLIVPPATRRIEVADLAGGWESNDGAGRAYANGGLQGGVVTHENWRIGADGRFDEVFKGAVMNGGSVRGIDQKSTGTVRIERDGTIVIQRANAKYPDYYIVRGWFYGADATIMKLNGPWHDPIAAKDIANPDFNIYMNHLYVRRR